MIKPKQISISLLLLLLPLSAFASTAGEEHIAGRVLNVTYDGTLVVAVDVHGEVVRLHGVDIPAADGDTCRNVRRFCRKMVLGKYVSIESMGRDRWGRTLGRIYIAGRCLNDALLKAGWAQPLGKQ